jgi:hypothetical protein
MHGARGPRCYWVELHHFDASVLAVYKDLGFKTFLILRDPVDHFVSDFNYHFRLRRPMYPAPGSWTEAGYGATSNMTQSEPARRYWEGRFDEAIRDVASPGMQMRCGERSCFPTLFCSHAMVGVCDLNQLKPHRIPQKCTHHFLMEYPTSHRTLAAVSNRGQSFGVMLTH